MANESTPLPPPESSAAANKGVDETRKDGAAVGVSGATEPSTRTDIPFSATATAETAPDPPISLPMPSDTDTQRDIPAPALPPKEAQVGQDGNMAQVPTTMTNATTTRTNPAQTPAASGPAKVPATTTPVPAPASNASAAVSYTHLTLPTKRIV